ncbi:magnesium-transporting ATPase (P-type) [Chryseobacterium sp. JUb7]|nr:magnesium-transporting ATPase (P-type) [Chryseobacterium sp. JUb7]
MELEDILNKNQYKFLLWFHIILSCFYLIGFVFLLSFYYKFPSGISINESILFNEQARIYRNQGVLSLIQFTINFILVLIIKRRFKYTKAILNLYSFITLLVCTVSLVKNLILDVKLSDYSYSIFVKMSFILILLFYIYYLNQDKFKNKIKQIDSIDNIGAHND